MPFVECKFQDLQSAHFQVRLEAKYKYFGYAIYV